MRNACHFTYHFPARLINMFLYNLMGFETLTWCFNFSAKSRESQKDAVTEKTEDAGDDNDVWKKLKDFAG